ncbi:MAG: DUF2335 domain-containing protein [Colwellia sp.]
MTNIQNDDIPASNKAISPTDQELTEVQGLLSDLPQEMLVEALMEKNNGKGGSKVRIEQAISKQYSGPLPPPEMLHDYDMVNAGFAERIVSMAEKEQGHRHSLENIAVNGAINKDKRSQMYALFCIIFLSILCGGLIYLGHDTAGTVLGGATLVSLAALFITGKRKESEDDANDNSPE